MSSTFTAKGYIGANCVVDGDIPGIITSYRFSRVAGHDYMVRVAWWRNGKDEERNFED